MQVSSANTRTYTHTNTTHFIGLTSVSPDTHARTHARTEAQDRSFEERITEMREHVTSLGSSFLERTKAVVEDLNNSDVVVKSKYVPARMHVVLYAFKVL